MPLPEKLKISIMVDYAHEPESIKKLLTNLEEWKTRQVFDKVIHIISCDGAGRDDWKKPVMGFLSYSKADFSFVTTDNYDSSDNPNDILNLLSKEYPKNTELNDINQWQSNKKYIKVINRDDAMKQSLELCKVMYSQIKDSIEDENDFKILIVSTGVGSEQFMLQPECEVIRDERKVWKELWSEFAI